MAAPSILVVDDQPINVQLLKRKLEREGIRATAAYNGLEALDVVKKSQPDLILLDVMMPDMDGIEVCQRLQANEDSTKNTVGVGMGLTVARHALRNLGGEVTMTDTPGGGATALLMHPVEKKKRHIEE